MQIADKLLISSRLEDDQQRYQQIQQCADELNDLDDLRISLMHTAEHKCVRRTLTKTYQWSTSLMEAGQRITFWKAMKKAIQMSVSLTSISGYASYLQSKLKITIPHYTIEIAKRELKQSWKRLREIQKEDRAHRRQYLEDLAEKKEKESGIAAASVLRQLLNNEENRDKHRKINYYMQSTRGKGLSSVLIPIGSDPKDKFGKKWEEVTKREEIEDILLNRNKHKFQESKHSEVLMERKHEKI